MPFRIFPIPNYSGTAIDLLACNSDDPNSLGVVHYAYTVAAENDAVSRRTFPWAKIRDFRGDYQKRHSETITRIKAGESYRPGERVLENGDGPTFVTDHDTVMRLGALELLANLLSGRLSTTDKDPFPHQLALQQYARRLTRDRGRCRLLIADEVGLGKTVEVGLIIRDILLARGRLDGFNCLYLTSGGLIDDAADKLRDVLSGIIDGNRIVDTAASFRKYGEGTTLGVHVASMHAARLYVTEPQKKLLPKGVSPRIIIIDECHHAASDEDLAGARIDPRKNATHTYVAVKQLLSGEYWPESKPPELAILMSATPFRSDSQFVNLLRLLTHLVSGPEGLEFNAYNDNAQSNTLRALVQTESFPASIVWRRQSDDGVRSWSGNRIFPNLTVVRPHLLPRDDSEAPQLSQPSEDFLQLLAKIKHTVARIAKSRGKRFGGFATYQHYRPVNGWRVLSNPWSNNNLRRRMLVHDLKSRADWGLSEGRFFFAGKVQVVLCSKVNSCSRS